MLKTLLLYCSILSVFASDAQYTPTPIACQPGVQCGNVVAAGNAMPTASDFQSVNRYVTPSDYSAAAGNPFGTYTPATVQNFYSVVSEETPPTESPFAPSVRKSPGVPKRAPVGDGVGALALCSALYTLYLFCSRYAKSHRPQSRRR